LLNKRIHRINEKEDVVLLFLFGDFFAGHLVPKGFTQMTAEKNGFAQKLMQKIMPVT